MGFVLPAPVFAHREARQAEVLVWQDLSFRPTEPRTKPLSVNEAPQETFENSTVSHQEMKVSEKLPACFSVNVESQQHLVAITETAVREVLGLFVSNKTQKALNQNR